MAEKKKGQNAIAEDAEAAKAKGKDGGSKSAKNSKSGGKQGVSPMQKLVGDALGKGDDKKKKKKDDDDAPVGESIKDIRQFLKEVLIEFQKITWPERAQVIRETYSVIFLVTVITLMVLGFDWVLGHAVFGPLEHWSRMLGGGVTRS